MGDYDIGDIGDLVEGWPRVATISHGIDFSSETGVKGEEMAPLVKECITLVLREDILEDIIFF